MLSSIIDGVSRHFSCISATTSLLYDANPAVALTGKYSRAFEEGIGILLGIRPKIRLVPTATNSPKMEALFLIRKLFIALTSLFGLLFVALALQVRALMRRDSVSCVSWT